MSRAAPPAAHPGSQAEDPATLLRPQHAEGLAVRLLSALHSSLPQHLADVGCLTSERYQTLFHAAASCLRAPQPLPSIAAGVMQQLLVHADGASRTGRLLQLPHAVATDAAVAILLQYRQCALGDGGQLAAGGTQPAIMQLDGEDGAGAPAAAHTAAGSAPGPDWPLLADLACRHLLQPQPDDVVMTVLEQEPSLLLGPGLALRMAAPRPPLPGLLPPSQQPTSADPLRVTHLPGAPPGTGDDGRGRAGQYVEDPAQRWATQRLTGMLTDSECEGSTVVRTLQLGGPGRTRPALPWSLVQLALATAQRRLGRFSADDAGQLLQVGEGRTVRTKGGGAVGNTTAEHRACARFRASMASMASMALYDARGRSPATTVAIAQAALRATACTLPA